MASVTEVRRNHEAFLEMLPKLVKTHPGQYALLYHGQLVEIFPTGREARWEGKRRYQCNDYSIQSITDKSIDLGWFSHVWG